MTWLLLMYTLLQSKTDILYKYLTLGQEEIHLTNAHLSQIVHYKLSTSPLFLYIIANELQDVLVNK